MVVPVVVPTYAAILALLFVYLSVRVIQMRTSARIGLGYGSNPAMERRIRVHGNFAEYVPIALLLLGFMEMQAHSRYLLHVLCIALIVARILHAIGVSPVKENLRLRIAGAALTFIVLIVAALFLLANGLRTGFI
jgi:uncharacterized membrane protein YecN with MAPEG domain